MIAADEKKVLRKLYKVLSDEQFEKACARPDPYLAGICTALGLEDDAADVPAPAASGVLDLRVRWHIGRAIKTLMDKGFGARKIRLALKWSTTIAYTAIAIYGRHPDGRIPELTIKQAVGYHRNQQRTGVAHTGSGYSVQVGLDAALQDLRVLARKSGLPLKADQIVEVAARRSVNPLVLMGAWGNAVLQQGAPTSQQIIEALQKELAARNEQFQTVMKELASKDERLAAQQQVISELSGRVDDLEKTVTDLSSALGVIQEIGIKLANFFQTVGAPSSRAERAA